jgi:sulfatase-like protein
MPTHQGAVATRSVFAVFLGLSSLVIAQPLFNSLGNGATFFVVHDARPLDIVIFTMAVYLAPAVVLAGIHYCLNRISPRVAGIYTALVVAILAAVGVPGLAPDLPGPVSIGLAITLGLLVAWLYLRRAGIRDVLQLVGMVSPVIVVAFLVFSPVHKLLKTGSPKDTQSLAAQHNTPIVVLLFDELSQAAISAPGGHIDAGRLPNFARLESLSTWYNNTITVSGSTALAVPAILSGVRPLKGSQPIYNEYPRNLFSLLEHSHEIEAMEATTRLCPESACVNDPDTSDKKFDAAAMYDDAWIVLQHSIVPRDIAHKYLPSISGTWRAFRKGADVSVEAAKADAWKRIASAGKRLAVDFEKSQQGRFSQFVSSIENSTGPAFTYLHLVIPHSPMIFLPDGTQYNGRAAPGEDFIPGEGFIWSTNQHLVDHAVLRYSLGVEYADRLLGELLDALEGSGRFDETLLIVLSDHGLTFSPGEDRRKPSMSTVADVARVPLFIKYPGQVLGNTDARLAQTIDLVPTVADTLGIPLPEDMEGQSLISGDWKPPQRTILVAGESIKNFETGMDMEAAINRIYRVLKPGKSALEALGLGNAEGFFGKPVPEGPNKAPGVAFLLDNAAWYADIDLDSNFLPARLTGKLKGAPLSTDVFIGLNGVIVGSGETYDDDGMVSIILDPRQFKPGANQLRVFLLEDTDQVLEADVVYSTTGWTVQKEDGFVSQVTDPTGKVFQPGEMLEGDALFYNAGVKPARISGWACDKKQGVVPVKLVLIEGVHVLRSDFSLLEEPTKHWGAIKGYRRPPAIPRCSFALEFSRHTKLKDRDLSVVALFEDGRLLQLQP